MIGPVYCASPQTPPNDPPVPCVECGEMFVWWVHPVQLCDACIDSEYEKARLAEESAGQPEIVETFTCLIC